MKSLSAFAQLARKAGVVPLVPQPPEAWGTRGTAESLTVQGFGDPVPRVPLVPRENNDGWDEEDWRAAFEERAGILEFDEGLIRAEAERLARVQVLGRGV